MGSASGPKLTRPLKVRNGPTLETLADAGRFISAMPERDQGRLLRRLGLSSTMQPIRGAHSAGTFAHSLRDRVVQGYSEAGETIGKPGDIQGHYYWPGSEQMFSSARDMAVFLAAQLGEENDDAPLRDAFEFTHPEVVPVRRHVMQAHAWEILPGKQSSTRTVG